MKQVDFSQPCSEAQSFIQVVQVHHPQMKGSLLLSGEIRHDPVLVAVHQRDSTSQTAAASRMDGPRNHLTCCSSAAYLSRNI